MITFPIDQADPERLRLRVVEVLDEPREEEPATPPRARRIRIGLPAGPRSIRNLRTTTRRAT